MNIKKTKQSSKKLYVIVVLLIISIAFNFTFFKNLISLEERIKVTHEVKVKEKEQIITGLQNEIDELKILIDNSTSENKEAYSKTTLQEQEEYIIVANAFVSAYLNYDTDTLEKRRKTLSAITTGELLNQIAPEIKENAENELSSDPTFVSSVTSLKVYITGVNKANKNTEVIVDVSYNAKGSEGESVARTFVYLQLNTEDNGEIKVSNFIYYPIK